VHYHVRGEPSGETYSFSITAKSKREVPRIVMEGEPKAIIEEINRMPGLRKGLHALRGMHTLSPVFDSFEVALIGNQRVTSAQGSVGTTSGSGGERDAQAISWRTGGRATSAARMA
jgi:hypothetical protein